MVDLVAVAKKALEKRRKDEQIEKAVQDNAFVNDYVQNNPIVRQRTKSNDTKDRQKSENFKQSKATRKARQE